MPISFWPGHHRPLPLLDHSTRPGDFVDPVDTAPLPVSKPLLR
jgi:hypothetical protein